ncbi:MAG: hypothetical protein LBU12_08290 [Deltaproteobacteria bacterium]|jgi:DNA polymerase|nr:hypothetical protein [Deltaproteobacteria bacterium]
MSDESAASLDEGAAGRPATSLDRAELALQAAAVVEYLEELGLTALLPPEFFAPSRQASGDRSDFRGPVGGRRNDRPWDGSAPPARRPAGGPPASRRQPTGPPEPRDFANLDAELADWAASQAAKNSSRPYDPRDFDSWPPAGPATARPPDRETGRDGSSSFDYDGERQTSEWIVRAETLEALHGELANCRLCRYAQGRRRVFPGQGPRGAEVMFVVEPPDAAAEEAGQWPSGQLGELLHNIVVAGLRLKPEDCFVTPILKCRPEDPEAVAPACLTACAAILRREIKLAAPQRVLGLGLWAARGLTGQSALMARLRPKKLEIHGTPVKLTYGLADMIAEPVIKKEVWLDIKNFFNVKP